MRRVRKARCPGARDHTPFFAEKPVPTAFRRHVAKTYRLTLVDSTVRAVSGFSGENCSGGARSVLHFAQGRIRRDEITHVEQIDQK